MVKQSSRSLITAQTSRAWRSMPPALLLSPLPRKVRFLWSKEALGCAAFAIARARRPMGTGDAASEPCAGMPNPRLRPLSAKTTPGCLVDWARSAVRPVPLGTTLLLQASWATELTAPASRILARSL